MTMFDVSTEKSKSIKIKNGEAEEVFKLTAILPKERTEIAVKRVYLQNGINADAFTQADFQIMQEIATVDVCVLETPERLAKHDSCQEWDDPYLISELHKKITEHTKTIERKLKKNRSTSGGA